MEKGHILIIEVVDPFGLDKEWGVWIFLIYWINSIHISLACDVKLPESASKCIENVLLQKSYVTIEHASVQLISKQAKHGAEWSPVLSLRAYLAWKIRPAKFQCCTKENAM